ncbi:hypothetical protein BKA62DRAFT_697316 [Auriculariales sp. MPI-PUGE-AT-0066]|nr:hypothetical protein BKA62DRAFT_697316 [Auriculariales sp. MPI-PUGE-AT-0066]
MTRGNQRELARAKNQKKTDAANKGKSKSGQSLQTQREADAAALREKQARKAAEKAAADAAGGSSSSSVTKS